MSGSKRSRRPAPRPRKGGAPGRDARAAHSRGGAGAEAPDLLRDVRSALAEGGPLPLLSLASALLGAFDPRSRSPYEVGPGLDRDEFLTSLLEVAAPETSALLTAVAELSGDELLRRRVASEVARRGDRLPGWLTALATTPPPREVVEFGHLLGDGENLFVPVEVPGSNPFTVVVYVDHNMGTIVKDAFVLPAGLEEVTAQMRALSGAEAELVVRSLSAAQARGRVSEAVRTSAMTLPPLETDSWPGCRALLEWSLAGAPSGGSGYDFRPATHEEVADVVRRFHAAPGAVADEFDLLPLLVEVSSGSFPGDPLRQSPVTVEVLLDHVARKVVGPPELYATVPDLLRAYVRFCHRERGVPAHLTAQTMQALDDFAPSFLASTRGSSPLRMGMLAELLGGAPLDPLDTWRMAVGGDEALRALDAEPLPDEDFDRESVPTDLRPRVEEVLLLVDGCCDALLDVEFRTACRRLLAAVVQARPEVLSRGRADTLAAALCWLVGKANLLFEPGAHPCHLQAQHLGAHFGLPAAPSAQRAGVLLDAVGGVDDHPYKHLGSPRYLTSHHRARIVADRDDRQGHR